MDTCLTLLRYAMFTSDAIESIHCLAIVNQPSKLWAIILGIVFAVIAIALAIASWTKWGQSKPLTKCVALAVLAHVWLLMYAYGTRVFHPGNGIGNTPASLSNGPMALQLLPMPSMLQEPSDQPVDANGIDANETGVKITAPVWAKPLAVAVPLEIPEVLKGQVPPPVSSSLANVQLDVPEELLQESREPILEAKVEASVPEVADQLGQTDNELFAQINTDSAIEAELAATAIPKIEQVVTPNQLVSLPSSGGSPRGFEKRVTHEAENGIATSKDIYQLRFSSQRSQIAMQNGGDATSEAAVAAALDYLAKVQQRDGSWNALQGGAGRETNTLNENRYGTGSKADTAMTGLALLAFLGDGNTHLAGTYQANVIAGLEYLIAAQMPSGDLAGPKQIGSQLDVRYARMYSHGIALLAIAEAYAITNDIRLRDAVTRGCAYTLQAQNPLTGGWRYDAKYTGDVGDLSQFGWQALAIQSSRRGGVQVPLNVIDKMHSFLNSVNVGKHGGLAIYRPVPNQTPTATMTAEAFASRALLGRGWNLAAQREATEMLLANLPGQGEENFYYYYYATLALFQQQGDAWLKWNAALKPHLVSTQRTSGSEKGSWDPTCTWAGYGGRIYSTAMGCMCLEIYYRYLPMYEN